MARIIVPVGPEGRREPDRYSVPTAWPAPDQDREPPKIRQKNLRLSSPALSIRLTRDALRRQRQPRGELQCRNQTIDTGKTGRWA
jgi:hypothetical protein